MILKKIKKQKKIEVINFLNQNQIKENFDRTKLNEKLSEKIKNYQNKGFYANLKKNLPAVIAECKKASPSLGILREIYNPVEIAKIYENLGASAISVLTDKNFFYGSLEDLKKVSEAVKIPVLRKDFLISEAQIYESMIYGADAVLLIVRLLSKTQLKKMIETCLKENVDYIVEIHNEEELKAALQFPVRILGINHRNLDTLEMNLELTKKLAPLIRKHNKDILIIAESGIEESAKIKEFSNLVDGFLIGTYFMKSKSIEESWKVLFS
ncbi:MAG: indole-3-glycerol phosphate synthase TrpC [Leptonema sp. (in: bacteria)]